MRCVVISFCLFLAGCTSLLPRGSVDVKGQWQSFNAAQETFERIIPYQSSVADLKKLGLDPGTSPNIALLNYSDILRRFIPSPSVNAHDLDTGVIDCIKATVACKGLEVDQRSIKRTRTGNFWADFMNFRRQVDVTGWHFNGIVLIKDDVVVYKLVGGQPLIHERETNRNPLGPLQGIGESTLRNMF